MVLISKNINYTEIQNVTVNSTMFTYLIEEHIGLRRPFLTKTFRLPFKLTFH